MLLRPLNLLNITKRFVGKKKYVWDGEYIQYPGFKYYPSKPDFQDPPYEPSKLFRVQRIKPLKGVPYYEKSILRDFKLDTKLSDVVILKNMPETIMKLWKIKHLIEIKPVTFPNGFPTDVNGTYLKENGELIVSHNVSEDKQLLSQKFKEDVKRLDGNTLRRNSRSKWLSGWGDV
ncbi:39S ribosomal protein L30, mitochondrial [Coccinella septempunctata]|uniref:39S ribosomal protein L30, mitochondrial n=1 Tax=Coccinella septempunctata TaxID=41139 RepID=UPI001D061A3A|nr:39S ribosomal protein L30, mitochondrial [Coccinella septempunctata]